MREQPNPPKDTTGLSLNSPVPAHPNGLTSLRSLKRRVRRAQGEQLLHSTPARTQCYLCDQPGVRPLTWSPIHHHCPSCGLIWLHERFQDDPALLYDESYYNGKRFEHTGGESGYPDSYADPAKSHRSANYACYAEQVCQGVSGETLRILDFGCGYGLFLRHVKDYVPKAELVGVEIDPTVANRAAQLSGCPVTTALPETRFDLIVLLDVLEHLTDPRTTLQRLFDHARAGSRMLLTTPNIASWNAQIFRGWWNLFNPPEHVFYFSPETVTTLLQQAGWQPVELHTQGHLLHNERTARESWRGQWVRRLFGGPVQDALFNQVLKVGPVLVVLAERPLSTLH